MFGAGPAGERFEAKHFSGRGVDHRLIDQREFVAFERVAQGDFELAALFGIGMERRFITEMRAAAFVLGTI